MTENELKILEHRFYDYTSPFINRAFDPYLYKLKQAHSLRVCENIAMLAASLNLGRPETRLARAAALVHDLGRFYQFETYVTFSDALSKSHGALGAGVMVKQEILAGICRHEKQLILRAVALHNLARLPKGLEKDLNLLVRLLRDADKIDIFKVIKAYYLSCETQAFLTHDLEDDGKVSQVLVTQLLNGRAIDYDQVATLNDMKLFQVGMVYDLNFPRSLSAVLAQGAVSAILGTLPPSSMITDLEHRLNSWITNAAAGQAHIAE
ncbi:MAG: HD domain-containing protein [Desulfobacter sp.]|nr:MAG: HD domain-containing protein [Desulfobacter sp.]